uniref:hypothetical protein n=1 Tax=Cupriavidus taiwanensis TaxID=164546 RepID=UPI0011C04CFB|nr:hypothetical protein [Cupriavidus taiwanensis]
MSSINTSKLEPAMSGPPRAAKLPLMQPDGHSVMLLDVVDPPKQVLYRRPLHIAPAGIVDGGQAFGKAAGTAGFQGAAGEIVKHAISSAPVGIRALDAACGGGFYAGSTSWSYSGERCKASRFSFA